MSDSPLPRAAQGVSVLVPVYNEAIAVRHTLLQLVAIMRGLGWPYEILVIDDGSTDGSRREIMRVQHPGVSVISHATNQGYGASLTDGLRRARFPNLVIVDADGTYPVDRIPDLLGGLDGAAMVVGVRGQQTIHASSLRTSVKWCLRKLAECLSRHTIPDLNSGLRALRRDALLPLLPILPQRFSWTSTVTVALLLQDQPVAFLPISYHRRQGVSKFHPLWDTLRAIRCIFRATAFGYRHRVRAAREKADNTPQLPQCQAETPRVRRRVNPFG